VLRGLKEGKKGVLEEENYLITIMQGIGKELDKGAK
jgi:hypothetical protein